jgi:hypothetical protein
MLKGEVKLKLAVHPGSARKRNSTEEQRQELGPKNA